MVNSGLAAHAIELIGEFRREEFRKLAAANMPPEVIARKLNRSTKALKLRAYIIGLPLKWFKVSPLIGKMPQKKKSFLRSD